MEVVGHYRQVAVLYEGEWRLVVIVDSLLYRVFIVVFAFVFVQIVAVKESFTEYAVNLCNDYITIYSILCNDGLDYIMYNSD